MNRPLSGLVILDLTRLLPGAYCTWLVASLGEEVIKVIALRRTSMTLQRCLRAVSM